MNYLDDLGGQFMGFPFTISPSSFYINLQMKACLHYYFQFPFDPKYQVIKFYFLYYLTSRPYRNLFKHPGKSQILLYPELYINSHQMQSRHD